MEEIFSFRLGFLAFRFKLCHYINRDAALKTKHFLGGLSICFNLDLFLIQPYKMSSRGPRFEYEIGEHVLCFEPDLSKARVLYDAKVVDHFVVKDVSGKKRTNYVVHFQGWNSSWDRQVADHYVLRNTEENREMMRKLADTAKKLKNGARRRKINTILHQAFGGSPPEFDEHSDSHDSDDESDGGKPGKGRGKGPQDKKKQKSSIWEFEIPDSLKAHLEDDYYLINKKNKLNTLPAKPCVIDILESFMKTFCVNYVCDPSGGREKTRNSNKHTLKSPPDKCVSLCKEFVDGLRIIFDFTLPIVLLYAAEQHQYETVIAQVKPGDIGLGEKDCVSEEPPTKMAKINSKSRWKKTENTNKERQNRSSPARSVSSSSSSDNRSLSPPRRVTRQNIHDQSKLISPLQKSKSSSQKHSKSSAVPATQLSSSTSTSSIKVNEEETAQQPIIPIASRTRRRTLLEYDDPGSLFPVMVKNEPGIEVDSEVFLATTSSASYQTGQAMSNGHGSDSMTMSSCHGREDAMDRILGWQLLPHDVKMANAITPSQIYGTVHLLRMFVKLPELIKKMKMKDVQLQIISKFIHHCLQYLVNHQSELFHNQSYIKA